MKKPLAFKDGEWLRPAQPGFKMVCCDCGSAHTLDLRVSDDNRVWIRMTRDAEYTGFVRTLREIESQADQYNKKENEDDQEG